MSGKPCAHPLCADVALYFERLPERQIRPLCRAHHLEWKYFAHVQRQRDAYTPRQREVKPCGTPAAAARHRRRREPVCELCRVAENERTNAFKASRRTKAGV